MSKEYISISEQAFSDFLHFYMLLLLYEGPKHGYGIIESIRDRMGRKVSPSQVYPFLRTLYEARIVKIHRSERRRIYELTEQGEQTCNELFKRFSGIIYTALKPNIHTCAHCGCKVYGDIYLEKVNNKELTFCCRYCADSYKKSLGVS